ncbi:MAG: nucleotide pyrophosphohydrolase [Acidobacteria bacterium]|nr:nucleotide pyrophosphohydrolase [Acidobacteriota bacterium]
MSFADAQKDVDSWISRFEEGYWKPLSMLARITEEVGELARLLNHEYGEKPKKPGEPQQEVGEEIADVIFVLLALANSLGIDMDEAFAHVMDKYRTRDATRWTPKPRP